MDLGTGISIASGVVGGISTLLIWRQTSVNEIKDDLAKEQRKNERLERRLSDCRDQNRWLNEELYKIDRRRPPPRQTELDNDYEP